MLVNSTLVVRIQNLRVFTLCSSPLSPVPPSCPPRDDSIHDGQQGGQEFEDGLQNVARKPIKGLCRQPSFAPVFSQNVAA